MKCLLKFQRDRKFRSFTLNQGSDNKFFSNLTRRFFSDFKFSENFIDKYKNRSPNFGFNGLGELVYRRTYSRTKKDGSNEEWYETVRRVVEGTFSLLK